MPFPFRNNPKITTNWYHEKTGKSNHKVKRAYYGISIEDGKIKIDFREEKKRLGGSSELERFWVGWLDFEIESQFAKDLKLFLDEDLKEEVKKDENKDSSN